MPIPRVYIPRQERGRCPQLHAPVIPPAHVLLDARHAMRGVHRAVVDLNRVVAILGDPRLTSPHCVRDLGRTARGVGWHGGVCNRCIVA